MNRLSPRTLVRGGVIVALLAIVASSSALAQSRLRLITTSTRSLKERPTTLAATSRPLSITFDLRAFHRLSDVRTLQLAAVPVAKGVAVDMDLIETEIVAPDAVRLMATDTGDVALPPLSVHVYRGKVTGNPQSEVVMTVSNSELRGWVDLGEKTYDFGTDPGAKTDGNTLQAYVAPLSDYVGKPMRCGVDDHTSSWLDHTDPKDFENAQRFLSSSMPAADGILYTVKGAFEADYEYLQLFGGDVQQAQDHMVSLIGMVSAIYERDLQCLIQIGHQKIYNTTVQPYKKNPANASMDQALEEMKKYWVANMGSVDRGFAHCMSGKGWNGVIGIAYLKVLCENPTCYGYSSITRTNVNQDVQVMAHEIGHNFGSKHTHDCSWNPAIDSCTSAEGGSCYGPAAIHQTLGTVMSYCGQYERKFGPKVSEYVKGLLASDWHGCVILSKKLTVNPALVAFPEVQINTPKDTTITGFFSNNSRDTVHVWNMMIEGQRSEDFSQFSPPLDSAFSLAPGESKSFSVHYESEVEEPAQCTLKINHDAQNPSPQIVGLQGFSSNRRPILKFVTSGSGIIDFGDIRVGETRTWVAPDSNKFYQNNGATGAATLHITETQIVGPSALEFQIVEGTAPMDLKSAERAKGKFRYTPQDTGSHVAWLVTTSNSQGVEGTKDSIMMIGHARLGPLLRFTNSARFINFHERQANTTYDTTFAYVYNAGQDTTPLTLYVDLEGQNPDDFINSNPLFTLLPGEGDSMRVQLRATENGAKEAMLVLSNIYDDGVTQGGILFSRDTIYMVAYIGVEEPQVSVAGEVKWKGVSMAPNPTRGQLTVTVTPDEVETGLAYTLQMINAHGIPMRMIEGRYLGKSMQIPVDVSDMPAGAYTVLIESAKGRRAAILTVVR